MAGSGTLHGNRITLRPMVRADVDAMASWPPFREPDLQWANLDLTFPAERDAYFERGRSNETRRRFVVLDERQDVIGTVGLRNLDLRVGEATLGIIIRADAVGQGYGTDTIRTALAYSFDVLELRRVLLDVAEANDRARHVYDKLGFTPIGEHLGPQSLPYVDMMIDRREYERRFKSVKAISRQYRATG